MRIALYFVKGGSSLYKLANERTLEYVCVASARKAEVGTYLIRPDLYRRENGERVNIPVRTAKEGMEILKQNNSEIFA